MKQITIFSFNWSHYLCKATTSSNLTFQNWCTLYTVLVCYGPTYRPERGNRSGAKSQDVTKVGIELLGLLKFWQAFSRPKIVVFTRTFLKTPDTGCDKGASQAEASSGSGRRTACWPELKFGGKKWGIFCLSGGRGN